MKVKEEKNVQMQDVVKKSELELNKAKKKKKKTQ